MQENGEKKKGKQGTCPHSLVVGDLVGSSDQKPPPGPFSVLVSISGWWATLSSGWGKLTGKNSKHTFDITSNSDLSPQSANVNVTEPLGSCCVHTLLVL